jgi:hypothetical protein
MFYENKSKKSKFLIGRGEVIMFNDMNITWYGNRVARRAYERGFSRYIGPGHGEPIRGLLISEEQT